VSRPLGWTAADQSELDVLLHTLIVEWFDVHRELCRACRPEPCPTLAAWQAHKAGCRACQGDAPLTFGPPCDEHPRFVEHGSTCVKCGPCPHLRAAVAVLVDWREARVLLSRAQALRTAAELEDVRRQIAELRQELTA
jgi:hypothetical protein